MAKNKTALSPEQSYYIGFAQTDGHLSQNTRNRGRFSIELGIKDLDIIHKLADITPANYNISQRTRDTNFSKKYHSVVFTVCDLTFRTFLNDNGVPYGKKSEIIELPPVKFSELDYWRGIIDGDGSLGFTADGRPFVSLVTSSEKLIRAYEALILKLAGVSRYTNRNKRDAVYNIAVFGDSAKLITAALYYDKCLGLNRKIMLANNMQYWKQAPPNKPKYYTPKEDKIILSNKLAQAATLLNRTLSSVRQRKIRLKGGGSD